MQSAMSATCSVELCEVITLARISLGNLMLMIFVKNACKITSDKLFAVKNL